MAANKAKSAGYAPAIGATIDDNPLPIAKLKEKEPIVSNVLDNSIVGNPLFKSNFGIFILRGPKSRKKIDPTILVTYDGQKNPAASTDILIKVKYIAQPAIASSANTVPLLITAFRFRKSR